MQVQQAAEDPEKTVSKYGPVAASAEVLLDAEDAVEADHEPPGRHVPAEFFEHQRPALARERLDDCGGGSRALGPLGNDGIRGHHHHDRRLLP